MNICVAQTRPLRGDIQRNIDSHIDLLRLAVSNGAEIIIFPELSVTGYEPDLSRRLATNQDDARFQALQSVADADLVTIGIGVPTRNSEGICVSMVLFQPHKSKRTYSKRYLHPDEEAFFVRGGNPAGFILNDTKTAFAICHELSVPEHSADAFEFGAANYIASVAKSADGVDKAIRCLSDIAKRYSMTVFMSNCIGPCGGFECAGRSSIWNSQGLLVGQLNAVNEGILMIDTHTQRIIEKII